MSKGQKLTFEEIAARQLADYVRLAPGSYFGEPHEPLSVDHAYQVQAAVARLRTMAGDKIAGYKLGCTSQEIERRLGLRGPIRGVLFQSELRPSGARVKHSSFANLAIEGEMAARVDASGRAVAVFPIIELHHLVLRSEPRVLSELIANNGLNGGVVLPDDEACIRFDSVASNARLRVIVNGECIDDGDLWCFPGGVDASLSWLNENLRKYGAAMKSGDLVLTGTPLGIHPVRTGDYVEIYIDARKHVHCFIE